MLKLNNLQKVYRTSEVETTALDSIDINIDDGEFVAIMGPSGCGKSTLLNIVGMLDNPSSGAYYFKDEDIASYSEAQLAFLRKSNIGFIFQSFNLIDELSVEENVGLGLLYHSDVSSSQRKQRVTESLEKMKIAHRAKHMPSQLSGGQQQRVAVARALVAEPALILADEPTGNLDSRHGEEVMGLLKDLNNEGATIVMVTHSESHASYASRNIQLFDGRIVEQQASRAM
ncbi:MAG: ABC transporter ATP-binding protein [Gammaproteobacteria bacterium]|nr:ABC transporter ATP-binding protein [Gammaproteobacteria bacterium]